MSDTNLKKNREEIEKLVEQVQKGDHDAFAKLYDIFIDPVYRYVYYRVKDHDAEDIVETVFLRIWENIRSYESKKNTNFSSWVFRIAHNLVIDYYRSSKDRNFHELDERQPDLTREHNPIRKAEDYFDQKNLKMALSKIRKKYQDIVVYKFVNGFSNKEIADIMKKSEGSIRILQFRALKALKDELDKLGVKY